MVVGLGTDLIEVHRIEQSIQRFGDRFLTRIYTPSEIAYCTRKQKSAAESFAARFAAKEAGAKALGTGISRGVTWLEIEVTREPTGKPMLALHGRAALRAQSLGVKHMTVSLTHTGDVALAVVVMES
jgi:holo-[acyl-carrier protein] synthase